MSAIFLNRFCLDVNLNLRIHSILFLYHRIEIQFSFKWGVDFRNLITTYVLVLYLTKLEDFTSQKT